MTLVEKLKTWGNREGEYQWRVEVWRSDTAADANLRVRQRVGRVKERPWPFANSSDIVWQNTEVTTAQRVREEVLNAYDRAEAIAKRFDKERGIVESI